MFKIKDLMIKIAPEGVEVRCCTPSSNWPGWTGWGCDVCTCTCSNYCGTCTMVGTCYPSDVKLARVAPGDLAELKAALKQQLEAVETQERLTQEGPEPRTLEEAEMLEAKLVEALEEVRAMKGRLGKGSTD